MKKEKKFKVFWQWNGMIEQEAKTTKQAEELVTDLSDEEFINKSVPNFCTTTRIEEIKED